MNTEWKFTDIEYAPIEIIDGDRGSNYPSQGEFHPEGYCLFLSANNVTRDGFSFNQNQFISKEKDDSLRKGKLDRFDIVLTTRGTVGNVAYYNKNVPYENVRINSGMVIFRIKEKEYDERFFYQFLKSPMCKKQFLGFSTGSAQPQLPIRDIKRLQIPIPPLHEQRAIADVLFALDDKIELNRRMNQTLEELAQTLFKHWFVDNPERIQWGESSLSDAFEINPSITIKVGEVAPNLDMANLPTKGHRVKNWTFRKFSSGSKFMNGDTLLARITPCLENGKTAFVDFLEKDQVGWGSTEFIVIRPRLPFPKEFGYYLARYDEFRRYAIQNMSGTSGRQRVPNSCFDNYLIKIPPKELLGKFENIVRPFMNQIRANDNQSRTLAELRDTLLPRLMSGQVRVRG